MSSFFSFLLGTLVQSSFIQLQKKKKKKSPWWTSVSLHVIDSRCIQGSWRVHFSWRWLFFYLRGLIQSHTHSRFKLSDVLHNPRYVKCWESGRESTLKPAPLVTVWLIPAVTRRVDQGSSIKDAGSLWQGRKTKGTGLVTVRWQHRGPPLI